MEAETASPLWLPEVCRLCGLALLGGNGLLSESKRNCADPEEMMLEVADPSRDAAAEVDDAGCVDTPITCTL